MGITSRKRDKKALKKTVVEFCNRARIGFSASGGTCRVLAGEAAKHYDMPFVAALRVVNRAAGECDGFYDGAFFEEGRGDARGFGRFLARNYSR